MVFQSYALFPHMNVFENVAFGLRRKAVPKPEITPPGRRDAGDRRPGRAGEAPPAGAVRRPAAAGRARPGAGQPPPGAAARRAARRARPQAPPGHAGRAEADPARGRHHVRLRDARPGRGAHHVGPHRGHERRRDRAARARRGRSTSTRRPGSWPASSARPTCSPAPSAGVDGDARRHRGQRRTSGSSCRCRTGRCARATRLELTVRPEKIDLTTDAPAGGGLRAARHRDRGRLPRHVHQLHGRPRRPAPTSSSSSRTRHRPATWPPAATASGCPGNPQHSYLDRLTDRAEEEYMKEQDGSALASRKPRLDPSLWRGMTQSAALPPAAARSAGAGAGALGLSALSRGVRREGHARRRRARLSRPAASAPRPGGPSRSCTTRSTSRTGRTTSTCSRASTRRWSTSPRPTGITGQLHRADQRQRARSTPRSGRRWRPSSTPATTSS